ncbi:MAG: hypothetical protein LJE69_12225 [Thiohalocapsa sp.]|jgi:hypothetical protein|uniref:hypothetical protein n=1 Tax=Thiohalocapsa sp. TaxID=2497641 RepID=UPI0025D5B8B4|nr:hypothetical protein [Thiohalocapsa sp.]MCG6942003.1 hypothetical protein [Thiohalocapsa sp.]
MLGKLLLTVAIIVLAFYAIRERAAEIRSGLRSDGAGRRAQAAGRAAGPRSRRSLIQIAAALVVVVMLAGSGLALWQRWTRGHDVVTVEVANPITGSIERFEARRTDVGDHSVRTLDGRQIRVSEVERIIVRD